MALVRVSQGKIVFKKGVLGRIGVALILCCYPFAAFSQVIIPDNAPIEVFKADGIQIVDTILKFQFLAKDHPTPGQIYLAPIPEGTNALSSDMLIIDTGGNILFRKRPDSLFAVDFTHQPNGLYTYFDIGSNKFYGFTSLKYPTPIDSFQAVNGYITDNHELRFLPNGGHVLLGVENVKEDIKDTGLFGNDSTILQHYSIQEFDRNDSLVFIWKTQDHFLVTDATHELLSSRANFIDYAHCNSLELDGDTAYILSSRNMDEITKIDRRTGNIIWRWGGKHDQFMLKNDSTGFSHQHFVRRLPNGNITMYDNGVFRPHNLLSFSRGVEYALDEENKTATEVWEFRHVPDVYAEGAGSVQRLANGNTFIDWGSYLALAITEVRPDGSTALEMEMTNGSGNPAYYSYRAYLDTQAQNSVSPAGSQQSAALEQNYPNPSNGITTISFSLGETENVTLALYDALGRQVRILFQGTVGAGDYRRTFDCASLPSGAYSYTLSTPSQTLSKILVILK